MRGKARYNKPLTFSEKILARFSEEPDPFNAKLKEQIRSVLAVKGVRPHDDPELLEAELISEGRWARTQLNDIALRLKKKDALAEIDDLTVVMIKKSWALRKVSLGVEEVLGPDVEPLQLADDIDKFVGGLAKARKILAAQPIGRLSSREEVRAVAEELALRVVRLARSHGLRIKAAGRAGDLASFSVVVRLLRLIGTQAEIRYELSTWRNIVGEIKRPRARTEGVPS